MIAVPQASSQAQQISIYGSVTDEFGRPVAGADVQFVGADEQQRALSKSAQTDPAGQFVMEVPPMVGTLAISAPGFATTRRRVTPATALPIDVQLLVGRTIQGRIVGAGAAHPIRGRVRVLQVEPRVIATNVDTDANGAFSISGVTPGAVELVAFAEGYAPEEVEIDASRTAGPLLIALKPTVSVRGIVRDQSGNPLDGAELAVTQVPPRKGRIRVIDLLPTRYVTDIRGRFRITVAPGRPAELTIRRPGCSEQTLVVDFTLPTHEITLSCS
jgi:hypothetical protein